jgi:hypothetical protein
MLQRVRCVDRVFMCVWFSFLNRIRCKKICNPNQAGTTESIDTFSSIQNYFLPQIFQIPVIHVIRCHALIDTIVDNGLTKQVLTFQQSSSHNNFLTAYS